MKQTLCPCLALYLFDLYKKKAGQITHLPSFVYAFTKTILLAFFRQNTPMEQFHPAIALRGSVLHCLRLKSHVFSYLIFRYLHNSHHPAQLA